jgi:hypothetical protein
MANLLARHDYLVTHDEDLLEASRALATPIRHRRSLGKSRVMVAGRR